MPHVSKQKLSRETHNEIVDFFHTIVQDASKKGRGSYYLFYALLTKTERIMLAKRLAVFSFLEKGLSVPQISEVLKMSPSTIDRLKKYLVDKSNNDSAWVYLKNMLKKHRQIKSFSGRIERLLAELVSFMPPNKSDIKNRWKFLKEENF